MGQEDATSTSVNHHKTQSDMKPHSSLASMPNYTKRKRLQNKKSSSLRMSQEDATSTSVNSKPNSLYNYT